MKRYLVFAGRRYYAEGGWDDFVGAYSELCIAKTEAVMAAEAFNEAPDMHWWQVVDSTTNEIVTRHDPANPDAWDALLRRSK